MPCLLSHIPYQPCHDYRHTLACHAMTILPSSSCRLLIVLVMPIHHHHYVAHCNSAQDSRIQVEYNAMPPRIVPRPDSDDDDSMSSHSTSSSEDEGRIPSPKKAAALLLEFITSLYMSGLITGKSFCIVCFYAFCAGLEAFKPYGKPPGDVNTGNYQKHCDRAFGYKLKRKGLYKIGVPGNSLRGLTRKVHDVWVLPPHEVFFGKQNSQI